ncbi:MAG TPA: hypothetical protein DD636_02560 [Anaerolineaceae bacterium]|jgi:hypothetical protein|nr:hypothetical protein [Anaerolineaceae bacterium]
MAVLLEKTKGFDWGELVAIYLANPEEHGFGIFDMENLLRALVKYGKAIRHTEEMYRRLSELKDEFYF